LKSRIIIETQDDSGKVCLAAYRYSGIRRALFYNITMMRYLDHDTVRRLYTLYEKNSIDALGCERGFTHYAIKSINRNQIK